jgi:hypothetical protein
MITICCSLELHDFIFRIPTPTEKEKFQFGYADYLLWQVLPSELDVVKPYC